MQVNRPIILFQAYSIRPGLNFATLGALILPSSDGATRQALLLLAVIFLPREFEHREMR